MNEKRQLPEDVRATLRTLEERANEDAAFAQRLRADPVGILQEAGVPPLLAQEIFNASPLADDVRGHVMDAHPCRDNSYCGWFSTW